MSKSADSLNGNFLLINNQNFLDNIHFLKGKQHYLEEIN